MPLAAPFTPVPQPGLAYATYRSSCSGRSLVPARPHVNAPNTELPGEFQQKLTGRESPHSVSHHSRNQLIDRHIIQLGIGKQRLHTLGLFG